MQTPASESKISTTAYGTTSERELMKKLLKQSQYYQCLCQAFANPDSAVDNKYTDLENVESFSFLNRNKRSHEVYTINDQRSGEV